MKSREAKNQSEANLAQFSEIERVFECDEIDLIEKIEGFTKYTSKQSIAKFLTKYELFKKILHVNGSVVECGVLHGAGLLTWAKLSNILEPVNHTRRIIGFDTFEGFPTTHDNDIRTGQSEHLKTGGLCGSSYDNVLSAVNAYDKSRPLNHIQKIELVKGDFLETAHSYLETNPHLVISLLYLDFDLYEPTKKALEVFVPRMPKGSLICFDELNAHIFPGETMAVNEAIGLQNLKIKRFSFDLTYRMQNYNCPLCNNVVENESIYYIDNVPVLQNKLYLSKEEALNAIRGNVLLLQCDYCKLVYNSFYDERLVLYDTTYMTDQSYSLFYKNYLNEIVALLLRVVPLRKVIEIGCGNGYFLKLLSNRGINVTGFDPAYLGNKKHIIKSYFEDSFEHKADLIILRHVLEHIKNPFQFLERIAKANDYKGYIYIEVPDLQWIETNNVFFDINYEHCNYFYPDILLSCFDSSYCGSSFGNQYFYIIGKLSSLRYPDFVDKRLCKFDLYKEKRRYENIKNIVLWGAGAKGVMFANSIDKEGTRIKFFVDINPSKQNKFIGGTGHAICSSRMINDEDVIIMNPIYSEEIRSLHGSARTI